MSWQKSTYLAERKYDERLSQISTEEQTAYWCKIIGDEEFGHVLNYYNVDKNIIFNSDQFEYNEEDLNQLKKYEEHFIQGKGQNERLPNIERKEGRLVFDQYYIPIIKLGVYELQEKCNKLLPAFKESFAQVLLERLSKISMGILMFEMQLHKKNGDLKGDDIREEYADYNDRIMGGSGYIVNLFEIYPCLKRLVFESISYFVNNYADLIMRLSVDADEICSQLCSGVTFDHVVSVQASVSDSHNRGRTVAILTFDNGYKVVYKPRSLKTESAYQHFVSEISKGCKFGMGSFKMLVREDYGWEEFVHAQSMRSPQEVKRYYYRFGVLVFTNYILNANDLHVENVIAMGEYPMVIDAETILDNERDYGMQNARMVISEKIHESVLYSGLLPYYRYVRKGKGINMSAINGQEGDEYPILVPMVKDAGTSDMRYEYCHPVTQANNNLARLHNEFISPNKYMNEVCEGFTDSYRYVLKNRTDILNYIKIFENLKVRHLIQDTQRYNMLLHTSFHPYFMQDGKDRNIFLGSLFKAFEHVQGDERLVKSEIEDMLHMDVPYFYIDTSKSNLYGSTGTEVEGYFPDTSMAHLRKKINEMSEKEMTEQIRFIKIALTNLDECAKDMRQRNYSFLTASGNMDEPVKSYTKEAANKIAGVLKETMIWGSDGDDISWMGITSVGQRGSTSWNIEPLGNYLYDGIAGIAIFFRALARLEGSARYNKICDAIEVNLFLYTDDILEEDNLRNESSGAFSGEGSIIYTYEVLYKITGNGRYLEYAKKHAVVLKEMVLYDTEYDIIFGNAGAVLVLLNLYELTHDQQYLEVAGRAGKILMDNQIRTGTDAGGWIGESNEKALSGFSHGAAGIIYALSKLWTNSKEPKLLEAIHLGLKFEFSLLDIKNKNWIDRRERTEEEIEQYGCFMTAWCHGAAGILLGRSKINNILPDEFKETIESEIENALYTTTHTGFTTNDCICHGNLGNTEILMEYANHTDDLVIKKYCKVARNKLAEEICDDNYECSKEYLYGYIVPGLMTGVAGMGYSLLRDIDKTLPCVMSLEI